MPDFVSENSLNASELEAQLAKARETNEKHMLEEEPERKSLYEQLKESKEQKHLEYQKLLETQNSSYKLDEKSAKFYDELKKNEQVKELKRHQVETEKLNMYRNLKKAQQKPISMSSPGESSASTLEIPSKSSIIIRKRKYEKMDAEIDLHRTKEPNKTVDDVEKSFIGESNDKTNTRASKKGIRHDETAEIKNKINKSSTLLGLDGYASSDEE